MKKWTSIKKATRTFFEMEFSIYALLDPRTGERRYVGRSVNPDARIKGHGSSLDRGKAKVAWIQSLKAEGLRPALEVLEQVRGVPDAVRAERRWIEESRAAGAQLLNVSRPCYSGIWVGRDPYELGFAVVRELAALGASFYVSVLKRVHSEADWRRHKAHSRAMHDSFMAACREHE